MRDSSTSASPFKHMASLELAGTEETASPRLHSLAAHCLWKYVHGTAFGKNTRASRSSIGETLAYFVAHCGIIAKKERRQLLCAKGVILLKIIVSKIDFDTLNVSSLLREIDSWQMTERKSVQFFCIFSAETQSHWITIRLGPTSVRKPQLAVIL